MTRAGGRQGHHGSDRTEEPRRISGKSHSFARGHSVLRPPATADPGGDGTGTEVSVPLVTLAELAAEGFGWNQYTKTPRDAVRVLSRELVDRVVSDDIGRLCVPREAARELLADRAAAEAQAAERAARDRQRLADLAARNRPPAGIPVPEGMEDAGGVAVMLGRDRDRKMDQRRTVVEEMMGGHLTYHPVRADR